MQKRPYSDIELSLKDEEKNLLPQQKLIFERLLSPPTIKELTLCQRHLLKTIKAVSLLKGQWDREESPSAVIIEFDEKFDAFLKTTGDLYNLVSQERLYLQNKEKLSTLRVISNTLLLAGLPTAFATCANALCGAPRITVAATAAGLALGTGFAARTPIANGLRKAKKTINRLLKFQNS